MCMMCAWILVISLEYIALFEIWIDSYYVLLVIFETVTELVSESDSSPTATSTTRLCTQLLLL